MADKKKSSEATVRNIRRKTRKKYSAEEKIRIVLDGLRGETTIAELCRQEGINQNLYYKWSKEFLEAGKQRLAGNTNRQATSDEVKELRREMDQLKLRPDCWMIGRTLRELSLPARVGATVVAVRRPDGGAVYSPGPDLVVARGDTLVLIGRKGVAQLIEELGQPQSQERESGAQPSS